MNHFNSFDLHFCKISLLAKNHTYDFGFCKREQTKNWVSFIWQFLIQSNKCPNLLKNCYTISLGINYTTIMLGQHCWYNCDQSSGPCNHFCGSGNYCCRHGYNEKGCDGKMADPDPSGYTNHHVCVPKSVGTNRSFGTKGQQVRFFFRKHLIK